MACHIKKKTNGVIVALVQEFDCETSPRRQDHNSCFYENLELMRTVSEHALCACTKLGDCYSEKIGKFQKVACEMGSCRRRINHIVFFFCFSNS